MTGGTIVTPSAEGAAATTLQGVVSYSPVPSRRTVIETTVPVGKPATDDEIEALRQRLRGE